MKLFFAPRSPFAIKVRIVAHELGVCHQIEMLAIDPWTDETLRAHNPLCKVPTLILDDGSALFDSRVICEFLDSLVGGGLFPPSGNERWAAARRQALADGLAEAVIRRFVERLEPTTERSRQLAARQDAAIIAAVDSLAHELAPANETVTIGDVATASALIYLSRRSPEIDWRSRAPKLAAWYDGFLDRPSCQAVAASPPS